LRRLESSARCWTCSPEGTTRRATHAPARRAHPLRVPLFEYDGVPPGQAASERIGWLRVLDPPALNSFTGPSSDSGYVVSCDVRLGWNEPVGLPPNDNLVETVKLHEEVA
jgi:hypothetical protein